MAQQEQQHAHTATDQQQGTAAAARKATMPADAPSLQTVWHGIAHKGAEEDPAARARNLNTMDSANMAESAARAFRPATMGTAAAGHANGAAHALPHAAHPLHLPPIACPSPADDSPGLQPSPARSERSGRAATSKVKGRSKMAGLLQRMVCCVGPGPRDVRSSDVSSLSTIPSAPTKLALETFDSQSTSTAASHLDVVDPRLTLKSLKTATHSHGSSNIQDADELDDFCDARSFASNSSFYTSTALCSPRMSCDLGSVSKRNSLVGCESAALTLPSPTSARSAAASIRDGAFNMMRRTFTPLTHRSTLSNSKTRPFPAMPLPAGALTPSGERPYWVPDSALPLLDPETKYIPLPEDASEFEGYWAKVPEESSPAPMPIDVMLNANYIARKAHDSIKGIKISDNHEQMTVHAKIMVMGVAHIHSEIHKKDGSVAMGRMRRDVKPGRMDFRGFFTEDRRLVFVVHTYGLGCVEPDTFGIEVITLLGKEDKIFCAQACFAGDKGATQQFVGKRCKTPGKVGLC